MAKAWVQDLWVCDHIIRDDDGKIVQRLKPTSRELQAIGKLPEQYRSARYGKGTRWRVNWIEDHDGKPVRKAESFTTKSLAEQRVTKLGTALSDGTHVTKEKRQQLLRDVSEMWLSSKQKIKRSTHKRYRNELDRYVLPKWGKRTLESITQDQVEAWVVELRAGTAPYFFEVERKPAPLGASSIKHIVRIVFGAVMKYAVNKAWIIKSPVVGVELPDVTERDVDAQILNPIELQALMTAATRVSDQDERIIRTMAFTGARIGEIMAQRVRDWDGKTLTIRKTLTMTSDGWEIGDPKNGKTRSFPVAPIVAADLNTQVEDRAPDEFIFRNTIGGHLDPNNWRDRVWSKAVAGAGIEIDDFTPHSLRHTAASMAISAGASVLVVQRMLGHKNATETLNTYSHLYPSDIDAVGGLMQAHYEQGLESN